MSDHKPFYSYFLLGMLAVSLYLAYEVLQPFLNDILMAIILVSIFHPVHVWLLKKMGNRKSLAAACSVILITLLIILPLVFFTGSLLGQAGKSLEGLQAWLRGAHLEKWFKSETLAPYLSWLQGKLPFVDLELDKIDFQGNLLNLSKQTGQFMLDAGTRLLSNALGLTMDFLIMLFVLFFLLRDGEIMLSRLKYLSPLRDAQENRILNKLGDVARSVVMGSFLVAVCQGVVGGIGLAIVGIPALFWGTMMGFASLIPVVGTMVIWGPAALYLLIMGDWKGAAILAGWGGIIVAAIDSVLRPWLLKGQAQMSTFYVFLSIIGGIKLFGPLGILYGPLTLALAMVMLSIYSDEYKEQLDRKSDSPDAAGPPGTTLG